MGHCFKIVPELLVAAVAVFSCGSGSGIVSALLSGLSGSQTESPAETFAGELSATKPEAGGALMEIPASDAGGVLITHKGYTLSYNAAARIPEWVAYELTADETYGDADRDDAMFRMDPSFKKTQAMREDYSGSGWTKGHMACAADFQWDEDAMDETFYLTNICPQDEVLNAGDWNYLEKQTRRWARENGRVWVVSGPIIGDNIYGRIEQKKLDLEVKKEELSTIVESTAEEEKVLSAKRAACAIKIDERTLIAYERIRTSVHNHLAVVPVYEQSCGGCFNAITPQRLLDIASGKKLVICEHCGRILVHPAVKK